MKLLTTKQVAELLGISESALEVWRCTKRMNLPYVKAGRCVRYRADDVERWLESRTVNAGHTDQTGERD